jgi:hypothetical protein
MPLPRYLRRGVEHFPDPMIFDFVTEFEEGGFLVTNNAEATAIFALPKSIIAKVLPATAAPDRIWATHQRELRRQEKRGRRSLCLGGEVDAIAAVRRLHHLKCDFRKRIQYVRVSEARALRQREEETRVAAAALTARYDFGPRERSRR